MGSLIQCNVPSGDVFTLEVKDGQYALKAGGAYAKLESDGSVSMSGGSPEWFYVELLVHTKLALKAAATGKYLSAEQTGGFKALRTASLAPTSFGNIKDLLA